MDDVAPLREALAAGTAYDEGQVELDGRIVQRIRVDQVPGDRRYFYVDPETFVPVRVEGPPGGVYHLGSLKVGPLRFGIVKHYLTYEYLPRTDDNLALTDISEQ